MVSTFGKRKLLRGRGRFNFLHNFYSNGTGKHPFYYYVCINQATSSRYVEIQKI